jgi:hypothetical protein
MIQAIHSNSYTPAAATASTPDPGTTSTDFLSDFMALFSGNIPAASTKGAPSASPATPDAPAQATAAQDPTPAGRTAPTAESVFGDNPWVDNPTGTAQDGRTWSYNPLYFATEATANKVAEMVGGKVIQQELMTPTAGSPLQQSQLNEMVQLKDGSVVNPGLIAGFYQHGYPQSMIDTMIQNEIQGV